MSKRALRMANFYEFACHYSTRLMRAAALVAMLLGAVPAHAATLCVLVPHFKDEYWLGVGYGLEQEALKRGVTLHTFEAGGYRAMAAQIAQIDACVAHNVDAILLGTVSSDHPDLLTAVRRAARTTPVFALVNELNSPDLSGAIGVDWRDMGAAAGHYLASTFPKNGKTKEAVLISGPKEAGWTAPLEHGLRQELTASSVRVVAVYGGDTGLTEQLDLVEQALREHPQIDILIGSAPAIEGAMGRLRTGDGIAPKLLLISTYVTHTIKRGLIGGQVAFAPFDDPQQQGRMAVSAAMSFLQTKQKMPLVGPAVIGMNATDPQAEGITLSPPDYFPVIEK